MAMKIGGSGSRPKNTPGRIETGDTNKVQSSQKMSFNNEMMKHSGQNREEALYEMAQSIIEQGKRLSEKVDISELKAYKRMIAEFLDEAVRGSNKFTRESFLDRRGRHRVYASVKKINEKLEKLTQEVLKQEKDNLFILNRIEDIRGLVLDLIL